jgi:hypothetical protein
MTAGSARFQGEHLIKRPSLRSRMIEWVLRRLRVKGRFAKTDGFRERVVKSRPTDPRPPRSFYRRYRVHETTQAGKLIFTISPRNREARKHLLYLHGLPPILVLTGTHDLLNSDAHRLQTLMASQPGALKMIEYRNMLHVWPSLPIREAWQAMDQILTFMQIGSHQERPQTVGREGNPLVPAPTKISGMRSATDDATQVKASDHSPAVVSRR